MFHKRIDCKCSHPLHFIQAHPEEDEEDRVWFYMVSTNSPSFWIRLVKAFNYVFFRRDVIEADMYLSISEIRETLNEIEKVNNAKRSSKTEA